jgi:4-hydroxy-tetrahydrodipicolinate reductase
MIRVGVLGADGRMGNLVWASVLADPELEPVAAIDPSSAGTRMPGGVEIAKDLETLQAAGVEVAVDFTRPDVVMSNIEWLVEHGVHAVVGTTGIGPAEVDRIRGWLAVKPDVGVAVAPNFAIGAVVAQRLVEEAARFFPAAEVIELHHDRKVDAPSGTAASTARRIASARREAWEGPTGGDQFRGGEIEGVRVHSVRLPGLVAHQEVIFGAEGQTLTIRHDAPDRSCYMPGVLLAIRQVRDRPGLTVGLESLLDL